MWSTFSWAITKCQFETIGDVFILWKSYKCVVSSAWRYVPRVLKRANVGTDDKYTLPRVLNSIRSVQATPTSGTVTEHNKQQILLFHLERWWHSDPDISVNRRYPQWQSCWFFCYEVSNGTKTVNVAALCLAIFVTASVIYKKSSASNKLNCNFWLTFVK